MTIDSIDEYQKLIDQNITSADEYQNLIDQNITSAEEPGVVLPKPHVPPHLAIYVHHIKRPTKAQLGRAAPKQAEAVNQSEVGYVQGREELNIWYGLCPTDGFDFYNRANREVALHRCNPFVDSGWTEATIDEEKDPELIKPFCLYFAKGLCTYGHLCKYHHRVPTEEDSDRLSPVVDIFGRMRHSSHRDDMDGVGSFQFDCRNLFVGDLTILRSDPNYHQTMVNVLFRYFSNWGPLENVKVIPAKAIAFLRYKYRAAAEFAKVAMAEQNIGDYSKQLCVRWAFPDRNPRAKAEIEAREWLYYKGEVHKKMEELDLPKDTLLMYRDLYVNNKEARPNSNAIESGPYSKPPPKMGPPSASDIYQKELLNEAEERKSMMEDTVERMNKLLAAANNSDDEYKVNI